MKTREKSVPYVPGTCARRLNQYMYHQERRPHDNDIRYWKIFVDEYYAPSAKKRWCVSLCGSNHPTITGVLPQDVWHCEICYRRPGRGFEATFEELPQLYQTKYASGTVQELLYIDMPRESQSTSGQIILDYSHAVQESVFEQLRVVRPGHLRVIYNPADYKIESWEFCIRRHQEFIPRGSIIPQVSYLGPAVQKYQAAVQNLTSLSAQNMQNNCNSMDLCNGLRLLENILDGSEKPNKLQFPVLCYITRNFSDECKIGRGGCGDVYKGIVKNGIVAVKRLFNSRTIDDNMFHQEVTTMMRVKHENIVRFLGYCSHTEGNLTEIQGKPIMAEQRERLLCLEYANNGSLKDYVTDELRVLEWHIRYQIIKGICNGLHHLHKEKKIIHMDLKPANILLDDHMVPKITDFGISRLDEKSQTMSQERLISLGYCAPEYQLNGEISPQLDIYSLGIIMMELVTGCKEKPNIATILWRWRYRWNKLNKHTPMEYHQVKKCIELAQRCMHEDRTKRPLIWDIISELNQMENGNSIIPTPCKIISSLEDMLGIEPLELHFPFDPSKKMSHSVQLTNNTDYYIAFRISTMNQLPYCIQPNKAIVPPQSCRNVTISLEINEKEPQYKYYTEEFSVQSTRVDADITTEDITHEMFTEVTDRVVDKVSLTVVLGMPQSPCCVPHLSAHKGSARPSSQLMLETQGAGLKNRSGKRNRSGTTAWLAGNLHVRTGDSKRSIVERTTRAASL